MLTDVSTGWTECLALQFRGQETVLSALGQARQLLPFPLLGLDTDNGAEFLNSELLRYCRTEKITFTRCRPYRKNDQCHVEQKNGSIVRRIVGYDRYEGGEACRSLATLYGVLRLYTNYFQPSLKLISKEREGSRVTKRYDRAQTPCQRLLASELIGDEAKSLLRAEYAQLDPVELLRQIEHLQGLLWRHAHRPAADILAAASPPTTQASSVTADHTAKMPMLQPPQPSERREDASENVVRFYRATRKPYRKPSAPRYWRTRADPFADVWADIEERLERDPSAETKVLFHQLQRLHPARFADGQLRTLQRRVRTWREARAVYCEGVVVPVNLLPTNGTATTLGNILT